MSNQYNILFSRDVVGFPYIKERLRPMVSEGDKVVIFPWAFPVELSQQEFEEEFFPKYGRRYERDAGYFRELGIRDEDIFIANCYKHSVDEIRKKVEQSSIVVMPGGNPVMLCEKMRKYHMDKLLKSYEGIIIGGSAGACIQFEEYFITKENNGPRGFQEFRGLGILSVDFMIDVHTNVYTTGENESNRENYMKRLKELSCGYGKDIYAIHDDGVILIDRKNKKFEVFGNVEKI